MIRIGLALAVVALIAVGWFGLVTPTLEAGACLREATDLMILCAAPPYSRLLLAYLAVAAFLALVVVRVLRRTEVDG